MVFHWILIDSKSPQVSRTRLRILAVLSNAVVWIVSTHPPTSKSSRSFNNPLVIVPNTPITIGTIVTLMFQSFLISLARSRYLSFFSLSFKFIMWSTGAAKSTILHILFFFLLLLIIIRYVLLAGISWSVCMLKSHRNLCVSFSRTGAGFFIYHLFVWLNWNFLHISQSITLPTQSCLTLYSFCANLLHYYYFYYYYYTHLRVFHASFSWWSLTVVCDSKSPEVPLTLSSILNDLNDTIILMVLLFPSPAVSLSKLEWLYKECQSQLHRLFHVP